MKEYDKNQIRRLTEKTAHWAIATANTFNQDHKVIKTSDLGPQGFSLFIEYLAYYLILRNPSPKEKNELIEHISLKAFETAIEKRIKIVEATEGKETSHNIQKIAETSSVSYWESKNNLIKSNKKTTSNINLRT
jgi:hypothetical protein